MSKRLRSVDNAQGWLFQPDPRWLLPEDHLAYQVLRAVGELNLSEFDARYRSDGRGGAAYDPAMMTALLFYCLLKKMRTMRKVAAACIDDLGAMVICGGQRPSYSTVRRFAARHRAELKRLFVQVLGLCVAEGMVDPQAGAVDGAPVTANASRYSNASAGKLAGVITGLQAEIDAEVEKLFAGREDTGGVQEPLDGWIGVPGDDDDEYRIPTDGAQKLAAKVARLGRLRHAEKVLAAHAAEPVRWSVYQDHFRDMKEYTGERD